MFIVFEHEPLRSILVNSIMRHRFLKHFVKPIQEPQFPPTLHIFQSRHIQIIIIRIDVLTIGVCFDCNILYKVANMAKNILA